MLSRDQLDEATDCAPLVLAAGVGLVVLSAALSDQMSATAVAVMMAGVVGVTFSDRSRGAHRWPAGFAAVMAAVLAVLTADELIDGQFAPGTAAPEDTLDAAGAGVVLACLAVFLAAVWRDRLDRRATA